jgi:hypothetical protein
MERNARILKITNQAVQDGLRLSANREVTNP